MPEAASPVVNDDRSITLSIVAPDSKQVQLHSDFRLGQEFVAPIAASSFPSLTRGEEGVWSVTTEPMLPGIYRYAFVVDGFKTLDPRNSWMRRAEMGQPFSMVRVPGDAPMPWDVRADVPHGTVVRETLESAVLDTTKRCHVYLPPGYDASRAYPVLYLLHGGGNDWGHWIFDGTADTILDTLLHGGLAKPMIVVMPDGNVMPRRAGGAPRATPPVQGRERIAGLHPRYFVEDVLPFVEARYSVSERAIAGLSMGCGQTWALVTSHPDLFTAAGLLSGGAADATEHLDRLRDKLRSYRTVFVGVGDHDMPRIVQGMRALSPLLSERGIPHRFFETPGGHIWAVWQRCLVEFAQLL